jgi:hypothetical protein
LAQQISSCRSLTVCLFFQLSFEFRNLLALEFDQGLDAVRLSLSAIP